MLPPQHPLKLLRESAGLTQHDISKRTGISPTRLSLGENKIGELTSQEEESIRKAIIEGTKERAESVLRRAGADPASLVELQESAQESAVRHIGKSHNTTADSGADRQLTIALKEIEANPSRKKLFLTAIESLGFSQREAAMYALGRDYPGRSRNLSALGLEGLEVKD